MPNVQAPDGTVVNFPDSMSNDDIAGVMRQHFPAGATGHANPSYWDDIKGGLHDLGTSVSQGAQAVGGVMARNGMPEWGGAVQGAGQSVANITPNAPAGPSPTEGVANAIKSGDYGGALSQLPHAALRAAVGAAPVLAAGALTGPVGAGVAGVAQALGPTAFARGQNNGRAEPNTSDVLGAIPGAAIQGAGAALLPGSGAASPLARVGMNIAKDAGAGAIMSAGGQLGGSVGTNAGAQLDPAEVAANAATMGTMGAARSVPAIGRATVGAASDNIMSRTVPQPNSPEEAASMARVGDAYKQALASNPNANPFQLMNSLKSETVNKTLALMNETAKIGIIPADTLSMAKKVLIDQAQRHNNTIDTGNDSGSSTLYQEVASNINDPALRDTILQGIQDTNTLSNASFLKNATGPFRAIGNGIGNVADAASLIGLAGHPLTKVAGGIGGVLDNAMGTATPKVLLQAIAARRMLAGADQGPNTLQSIADARANVAGMPTPPGPPAKSPGFIQPNGAGNVMNPAPAAPTPATPPGFIKPLGQGNVMNPDAVPQAQQAPSPIAAMMAAKAGAQLPQEAAPQQAPPFIRPPTQGLPTRPVGVNPVTGNAADPVPVNTPIPASKPPALPPFAPDTPATVQAALQQADLMMGKAPGAPQAAPQAPSVPGRGAASSYIGNPLGASHDEVMAAVKGTPLESLVANGGATPIDPSVAKGVQQSILAARQGQAGSAANIGNPIAYAASANGYQARATDLAKQLRSVGLSAASDATSHIAGIHRAADKQAARAALPPEVAQHIPDFLVNHGGK